MCRVRKTTVLLATISLCTAELSAEPSGLSRQYPKIVESQPVEDVLRDFGRDLGYMVVVDPAVQGTVRQTQSSLSGKEFLSEITASVSAVWYGLNHTVHVVPLKDVAERVFDTSAINRQEVSDTLSDLGFQIEAYPIQFSEDGNIAIVSAPLELLNTVSDIIVLSGGRLIGEPNQETVIAATEPDLNAKPRVFRGRVSE